MTVPVAMIVAVGTNGVIGDHDKLPWRLPSDFAFFKRTTLGKPLIMGRKTFESIGKPLPDRTNIVVTRREDYAPEGVLVVNDLAVGLAWAQQIAASNGATEVIVGGGGEIYREAMPFADRLYVTHVEAAPVGDTTFPAIDPNEWEVADEPDIAPSTGDSAAFRVKVYERRVPERR